MEEKSSVLIVENNLRARHALKALLTQQAGIEVTGEASHGEKAIQSIRGQIPDIILMDILMPIMDGLEATRIIKKRWPMIKVIILTMYPNYRSEALSAGADAFLLKGCPCGEMIATIQGL